MIVLLLFGATAEILPKAMDYIFIMAIADGLSLLITLMVLVGDNRKNFPKDTDGTGKLRKAGNF